MALAVLIAQTSKNNVRTVVASTRILGTQKMGERMANWSKTAATPAQALFVSGCKMDAVKISVAMMARGHAGWLLRELRKMKSRAKPVANAAVRMKMRPAAKNGKSSES